MTSARKGELVIQRLESLFGNIKFDDDYWRERNEPFWLIAETILSQNTSSANSRAAFRSLFSTYQTVEAVSVADVQDIERAIKQAGLYETKARSISAVASEILEKYEGEYLVFYRWQLSICERTAPESLGRWAKDSRCSPSFCSRF